ncbi:MAG TPA: CRISPR-associated endonuclease Cas1, partial [Pirellulaceae bacterium]|nr:CRISPR-associated endonuclease Cas1 [Pirellulaceae bacterium]
DALMRWIETGAPQPGRGVPTGAPLSPLLANLFLDEFDEALEKSGRRLLRYADDFVVLFRDRSQAEQVQAEAREAAESLRLQLNDDKTHAVELAAGFDFLGYRFALRDSWEFDGPDGPRPIDQLGWKERPRSTQGTMRGRLPGESDLATPLPGVVVAGPDLQELRVHNENLQFEYREQSRVESVRLAELRELIVIGPVALPPLVLDAIQRHGVIVSLIDAAGRSLGWFEGNEPGPDAAGIAALVDASRNRELRLTIARQLISAKLNNYAALAREYPPTHPDDVERRLGRLSQSAAQASAIEELLGIEGQGAAIWYGALGTRLPSGFTWTRRVAPHADDPVNILLNLSFTVLYRLTRHSL